MTKSLTAVPPMPILSTLWPTLSLALGLQEVRVSHKSTEHPLAYSFCNSIDKSFTATFSALGILVCFGGASLSMADPSSTGLRAKKNVFSLVHMPYPKTLADLLVAERARAEQLAVRTSEEAEVRCSLIGFESVAHIISFVMFIPYFAFQSVIER